MPRSNARSTSPAGSAPPPVASASGETPSPVRPSVRVWNDIASILLPNPERTKPRRERGRFDPEQRGRRVVAVDPTSRPCERSFEIRALSAPHLLLGDHRLRLGGGRLRRRGRSDELDVEAPPLGEDHRPLDDVLQLPHVARPVVLLELLRLGGCE